MAADKKEFRIDLKWPEMRSKVIFGHPKRPFCQTFQKYKKFRIDLKCPEMRSKVISDIQND